MQKRVTGTGRLILRNTHLKRTFRDSLREEARGSADFSDVFKFRGESAEPIAGGGSLEQDPRGLEAVAEEVGPWALSRADRAEQARRGVELQQAREGCAVEPWPKPKHQLIFSSEEVRLRISDGARQHFVSRSTNPPRKPFSQLHYQVPFSTCG